MLRAALGRTFASRAGRRGPPLLALAHEKDVVLLGATVTSIQDGAEPTVWHGLSAAYLGITVVYGHRTVRWADAKFARRFGGAAAARRPELYGRAAVVDAWKSWLRFLLAYAISVGLIFGLVVLIGTLDEGAPVLLYSLIWPTATTIWPGKAPETAKENR
ncbi:hypothetical protein AB0C98_29315 [Streptomyces sp. NPDC048558]|uniref:hypothetical protein n=1 Tax=Streptomyces sp. NPDC048558 TaxID=3155759 RepID=UPI00343C038C